MDWNKLMEENVTLKRAAAEEEQVWIQEMRSNCVELQNREVYAMQVLLQGDDLAEITADKDVWEYISYVEDYPRSNPEWNAQANPQMCYLIDEEYKTCYT